MLLHEFLNQSGVDPKLVKLFAETITLGVVRVRQAIEGGNVAKAGSSNVSGDEQLALDLQANAIIMEILEQSGLVDCMASEEEENVRRGTAASPFSVAFDPLDGSSLVDVNFAVGSIFGIYPSGGFIGRRGAQMLASAIVVYGPRTTMIFSVGHGTHECMLNQDGQFYITKENLKITDDVKHFAPGNLRATSERKDYLNLLNYWVEHKYTLRYSGGMVPDVNHILLKGEGIFTYPGYSEAPEGKLRLLFECAPMSFLVEQAGGAATDGKIRLLEKEIKTLHQRTPIFIGSEREVKRTEKILSQST